MDAWSKIQSSIQESIVNSDPHKPFYCRIIFPENMFNPYISILGSMFSDIKLHNKSSFKRNLVDPMTFDHCCEFKSQNKDYSCDVVYRIFIGMLSNKLPKTIRMLNQEREEVYLYEFLMTKLDDKLTDDEWFIIRMSI